MSAVELHTLTGGAIVHVLWMLLLLVSCIAIICLWLMIKAINRTHAAEQRIESYVNLALTLRSEKADLKFKLEDQQKTIDEWKIEIRRVTRIREKSEDALKERNERIDVLTAENTILQAYWESMRAKSNP